MPRHEELEDVNLGPGELVRETELAVLVRIKDRKGVNKELWIPKSQLTDDSEVYGKDNGPDGKTGDVIITGWFAEKEGLE